MKFENVDTFNMNAVHTYKIYFMFTITLLCDLNLLNFILFCFSRYGTTQ